MKKRILSIALVLVLAFSILPASGAAADTKTVYLKVKESEYVNDRLERYTLYTYDTNGALTQEDCWASESEAEEFDWHAQNLYSYNSRGDLTRSTYLQNDKIIRIYDHVYLYGPQYTKRAVYETLVYISSDAKGYNGFHETYYDAAGNVSRVLHYDAQDQLKSSQEYAYDARGNQISVTRCSYNGSGEAVNRTQTLYVYDAYNRLIREYDPDRSEEDWKTYSYDESGQLIRTEYSWPIGVDDGSVYPFTTEYTYDEHGNPVSETTVIRSRPRENPTEIHTSILRLDYEYQAFEIPVQPQFEDVEPDGYYRDAVEWAVRSGVTNGTSKTTFSPGKACTRAEAVTFLWRAAGSPEPQSTTNPFADVKPGDYFYQAVLWAVEQGITNGMNPTQFAPNAACTRAHVVTFLWRWHEKPAAGERNPFTDVPAGTYYTEAVLWAVSKNITNGIDETHFGPDSTCRRGQIVTFLYRDLAK